MGYRANMKGRQLWSRFLAKYKEPLELLGISEVAFRSEGDWHYFVEHLCDREYSELLNLENWDLNDLRNLLPVFERMRDDGFNAGEIGGVLEWLEARLYSDSA